MFYCFHNGMLPCLFEKSLFQWLIIVSLKTIKPKEQAMNNVAQNGEKSIIGAIKIDKKEVQEHLNTLVKESVEEVLNKLLNAEADAICNASRYERSPDRLDTRAGTYKRKLLTKAGEVELQVPRLRTLPFETQIIERYRRKESSVEEAMVEMYLAGV